MFTLGTSVVFAVALSLGVALVGALVGRFAPSHRPQVRRALYLVGLYWLALGAHLVFVAAGASDATLGGFLRHTLSLLAIATTIKLAGLLVFDLLLPRVGLELPSIVEDLALGTAYLVVLLVTLRGAGMELSGLVTTSAVVTGIVALSFQATLSNVIGGLALQLDHSFAVGDWVQLPDGKQARVREIRWRYTRFETRDWSTLIVPNATLLNSNLLVLGKREGEPLQHRMWVYFHVDFRFSPDEVNRVVNEALRASPIPHVAERPPPVCLCLDLAHPQRDSVGLYVAWYWLTDLARDEPTSSLVRARIHAALARAGIPLAIPARQVFLEPTDARRARKQEGDRAARELALDSVGLFGTLTTDERESLLRELERVPFAGGEVITKQGAAERHLYVLTEGVAEIWIASEGQERLVTELRSPTFFGEMSLVSGEPRAATVRAKTAVVCYRLAPEPLRDLFEHRATLVEELCLMLAERQTALDAARDHLDLAARSARAGQETKRLLDRMRRLFGLRADA